MATRTAPAVRFNMQQYSDDITRRCATGGMQDVRLEGRLKRNARGAGIQFAVRICYCRCLAVRVGDMNKWMRVLDGCSDTKYSLNRDMNLFPTRNPRLPWHQDELYPCCRSPRNGTYLLDIFLALQHVQKVYLQPVRVLHSR